MKIAIISDIHDNLENLRIALNWIYQNNVNNIICCGDVTNDETLSFLSHNFSGDIYLVKGNCALFDEERIVDFENIKYFGRIGRFKLKDQWVGLCHEPFLRDSVLKLGTCDIVFYGHTHEPWEENYKGVRSLNPGTLGGVFLKATFALWDIESGKIDLKVLSEL